MSAMTDTETLLICFLWVIMLTICCIIIIMRTPNK